MVTVPIIQCFIIFAYFINVFKECSLLFLLLCSTCIEADFKKILTNIHHHGGSFQVHVLLGFFRSNHRNGSTVYGCEEGPEPARSRRRVWQGAQANPQPALDASCTVPERAANSLLCLLRKEHKSLKQTDLLASVADVSWQWLTAGTEALATAVLEASHWHELSWRLPLTLP